MSSRPELRGTALPLYVEGGELVVRGRDGAETRLPLSGHGAVAALAPYRYATSTTSTEHRSGRRTWWRVGDRGSGDPPPGSFVRSGSTASGGVSWGRSTTWSFSGTVEWGVAALDRDGTVLLRMRPLRSLRRVRRFAQACGLAFVEDQITDPARLGPSPEVVTSVADAMGPGPRRVLDALSWVPAGAVGLAAFAALDGGPSLSAFDGGGLENVGATITAFGAFAVSRHLVRPVLARIGAQIASRSGR